MIRLLRRTLMKFVLRIKSYKDENLTPSELANALIFRDYKAAQAILDRGVDVNHNVEDENGCLHILAPLVQHKQVKWLIEHGADVNKKGKYRRTPLIDICDFTDPPEKDRVEMARLLIEHGADINSRNVYMEAPLHVAAEHGNAQLVQLLLDYGADINALKDGQKTPLHEAGAYDNPGSIETIRTLLEYGADVFALNEDGQTPRDLAEKYDCEANAKVLSEWELLVRAGKTPPPKIPTYGRLGANPFSLGIFAFPKIPTNGRSGANKGTGVSNTTPAVPQKNITGNDFAAKYLGMSDKEICAHLMTEEGLQEVRSVLQGDFESLVKRMPHKEAMRVYVHIYKNLAPEEKASFEKGIKAVKAQEKVLKDKMTRQGPER